jgi:hypothetical protein
MNQPEAPHLQQPERFAEFKRYLYAIRVQEGASIPTEEEYASVFDLLETAFPWPNSTPR